MINLTPHSVTVLTTNGDVVFPPSGLNARVNMVNKELEPLNNGVPVVSVEYGEAILPDGITGPVIVSTMFADAFRNQFPDSTQELYVPDSGPSAVRDNGHIKAVRALIRK